MSSTFDNKVLFGRTPVSFTPSSRRTWQNSRPATVSGIPPSRMFFCFVLFSPFFPTGGMEVTAKGTEPAFHGKSAAVCGRSTPILVSRSREIVDTIHSSPSLPFAGSLSPSVAHPGPPFVANPSPLAPASLPTDAHVPLGLLVAYKGMSWSPAPEPAPRQPPPRAPCSVYTARAPQVSALPEHPPLPAPPEGPPVPAPPVRPAVSALPERPIINSALLRPIIDTALLCPLRQSAPKSRRLSAPKSLRRPSAPKSPRARMPPRVCAHECPQEPAPP